MTFQLKILTNIMYPTLCYVSYSYPRCECEACTQGWGTYPELQRPLTLKCPHCCSPLPSPPIGEGGQKIPKQEREFCCAKCTKKVNFEQMTSEMVSAKKCRKLILIIQNELFYPTNN